MERVYGIVSDPVRNHVETTPDSSMENMILNPQRETEFKTEPSFHKLEKIAIRKLIPIHKGVRKHKFLNGKKASLRAKDHMKAKVNNPFEESRQINRHNFDPFNRPKWWLSGDHRVFLATNSKHIPRIEKSQERHWSRNGMKRIRPRKIYDKTRPKELKKTTVAVDKSRPKLKSSSKTKITSITVRKSSPKLKTGSKTKITSIAFHESSPKLKTEIDTKKLPIAIHDRKQLKSTIEYRFHNISSHPISTNHTSSLIVKNIKAFKNSRASSDGLKNLKGHEKIIENISRGNLISRAKHNRYILSLNKVENREKHDALLKKADELKESGQSQSRSSKFWKSPYFIGTLSSIGVLMILVVLVVCVYAVGKLSAACVKKRKTQSSSMECKHEFIEKSEYLTDSENTIENEINSVICESFLNQELFQTRLMKHNPNTFGLETILERSLIEKQKRNPVCDKSSSCKGNKNLNQKSNPNPGEKLKKLHENLKLRQKKETLASQKSLMKPIIIDKHVEERVDPKYFNNNLSSNMSNHEESQDEASDSEDMQNHYKYIAPSPETLRKMLLYLEMNPSELPFFNQDIKNKIREILDSKE